jgi:hypothetical protein
MKKYKLTKMETKFADIIWAHVQGTIEEIGERETYLSKKSCRKR